MIREIKFRAWDPTTETRIDDKYLAMRMATGALVYATDPAEFGWYDDTDYVLEQFTGLLDENGLRIYEGDIVVGDHYQLAVVEFVGARFRLDVRWKKWQGPPWRVGFAGMATEMKVIGNIHENADLLG